MIGALRFFTSFLTVENSSSPDSVLSEHDDLDTSPLTLQDFLPGKWHKDQVGETKYQGNRLVFKYIIDETTGKRYRRQLRIGSRYIFATLALVGPVVQGIALLVNLIFRSLKLISLSHFWYCRQGEEPKSFKGKLEEAGLDLLRIVSAPIVFLGFELIAIYGIFSHHNGKKIYSSLERAQYTYLCIAPWFQPHKATMCREADEWSEEDDLNRDLMEEQPPDYGTIS